MAPDDGWDRSGSGGEAPRVRFRGQSDGPDMTRDEWEHDAESEDARPAGMSLAEWRKGKRK